jgi:hypothetical protein
VLQHEVVETVSRLIRVNLDGQVDFLAGMRVQQMQTELDEALTSGNMLVPTLPRSKVWTSFHARARGDVAGDVECLDENEESVEAHHMPPTIEVDMKGAAITDVSGAFLLGDLVTGLQRRGCNVRVINALPECRVRFAPPPVTGGEHVDLMYTISAITGAVAQEPCTW